MLRLRNAPHQLGCSEAGTAAHHSGGAVGVLDRIPPRVRSQRREAQPPAGIGPGQLGLRRRLRMRLHWRRPELLFPRPLQASVLQQLERAMTLTVRRRERREQKKQRVGPGRWLRPSGGTSDLARPPNPQRVSEPVPSVPTIVRMRGAAAARWPLRRHRGAPACRPAGCRSLYTLQIHSPACELLRRAAEGSYLCNLSRCCYRVLAGCRVDSHLGASCAVPQAATDWRTGALRCLRQARNPAAAWRTPGC